MERRQFLKRLLAGAAGAALATTVDVEKLLWVPGEKKLFLPPVTGWTPARPFAERVPHFSNRSATTLMTLTQQVHDHLRANLPPPLYLPNLDGSIGRTFYTPKPISNLTWLPLNEPNESTFEIETHTFNEQFSVSFSTDSFMRYGATPDEQIKADRWHTEYAADNLVDRIRRQPGRILAYAKPYMPAGVEECVVVKKDGVSVRGIRAYDIQTDRHITQFDVLMSIE